jgi:hypothetical protein
MNTRKTYVVYWYDHEREGKDVWRPVYRLPGWSGAKGRAKSLFALRPAIRELFAFGFDTVSILVTEG